MLRAAQEIEQKVAGPVELTTRSSTPLSSFSFSPCFSAFILLRSNLCACSFGLEWPRAVESVHDVHRVAAESTRDLDVHHRHERVPSIPKTSPTPTTRPRARTQALGEQTRDLLDV